MNDSKLINSTNTEGHFESIGHYGHWELCPRLCLSSCGRAGCCLEVLPSTPKCSYQVPCRSFPKCHDIRDESNSSGVVMLAVHHSGFKAEVGAGHATRLCSRKKDLTAKSRLSSLQIMKSVESAMFRQSFTDICVALRYSRPPSTERKATSHRRCPSFQHPSTTARLRCLASWFQLLWALWLQEI